MVAEMAEIVAGTPRPHGEWAPRRFAFGIADALLVAFLQTDYRGPFTWALGFGLGAAIILVYWVFGWIPIRWRSWQSGAVLAGLAVLCVGLTLVTSYIRLAWLEDICLSGSRCQSIVSALTALFIVLTATFGLAAPLPEHRARPAGVRSGTRSAAPRW